MPVITRSEGGEAGVSIRAARELEQQASEAMRYATSFMCMRSGRRTGDVTGMWLAEALSKHVGAMEEYFKVGKDLPDGEAESSAKRNLHRALSILVRPEFRIASQEGMQDLVDLFALGLEIYSRFGTTEMEEFTQARRERSSHLPMMLFRQGTEAARQSMDAVRKAESGVKLEAVEMELNRALRSFLNPEFVLAMRDGDEVVICNFFELGAELYEAKLERLQIIGDAFLPLKRIRPDHIGQ